VFDREGTKVLPSFVLVDKLRRMEDAEYDWNEFKGIRPLKQSTLAQVMRSFQIKPQSVWWPEGVPRPQQKSHKGYVRDELEVLWKRYGIKQTPGVPSLKLVDGRQEVPRKKRTKG
jgi:hypothetical protein